jgi:hypothetical protein
VHGAIFGALLPGRVKKCKSRDSTLSSGGISVMLMKIVTYVVIALLVLGLAAAAAFYVTSYKPMVEDYTRMKAGLPELDKANAELKRIKNEEKKETAWLQPASDVLNSTLSDEIKSGKAEVFTSGNRVIINIAEGALYLPGSYTFSKESPSLRTKLVALLKRKEFTGKNVCIGNTTDAVPAKGRGRRRVPAKDARTLASERSAALIRDFEKNGIDQDSLIAAAYSSKQPAIGFKIKTHKTTIIIETPLATPQVASKQVTIPAVKAQSAPAVPPTQPKAIPIQPAQPKTN